MIDVMRRSALYKDFSHRGPVVTIGGSKFRGGWGWGPHGRDMAGHRDSERKVVITGIGVVSPIGIGIEDFWNSLEQGLSGIRPSALLPALPPNCRIAAEVQDFNPSAFTKTREQKKAVRVMCR